MTDEVLGIRPPRVSVTADDLDEKIPSMAQQAGQMLFMFYRRIIALRKIIQQRTDIGGSSEFVEIESTISALRGFQNNHREWINMGITALPELSVRSRQFVCKFSTVSTRLTKANTVVQASYLYSGTTEYFALLSSYKNVRVPLTTPLHCLKTGRSWNYSTLQ